MNTVSRVVTYLIIHGVKINFDIELVYCQNFNSLVFNCNCTCQNFIIFNLFIIIRYFKINQLAFICIILKQVVYYSNKYILVRRIYE